jgi:hypothetical protein
MALIDMAYDADEVAEHSPGSLQVTEVNQPKYPWGLMITLNEEALEKLGLTSDDFEVGKSMMLTARTRVVGISEREYEGSAPCCCVDLQITKLDLKSAPAEMPKGKDSLGGRMYG